MTSASARPTGPGVDLTRINGLGVTSMMKLLTEIGPDLGRFATVKHFCSWLGPCPGTKISGGVSSVPVRFFTVSCPGQYRSQ